MSRVELRGPARAAIAVGWTASMLVAVESHKLASRVRRGESEQEAIFEAYMRRWTRGLLHLAGVRERVLPAPPAPATGGRVVICNHRSALDIPLLLTYFGGSFVSRGDIADWPLLGVAARRAQTIFVGREDAKRGGVIRAMRAQLERGRTVLIFPEGTTFAGDEVRPFHRGAFVAATGLPVEIVPVGVAYPPGSEYVEESFVAHIRAVGARRRTPVVMQIGASSTADGTAADMVERYQREVAELVASARRAAGPSDVR